MLVSPEHFVLRTQTTVSKAPVTRVLHSLPPSSRHWNACLINPDASFPTTCPAGEAGAAAATDAADRAAGDTDASTTHATAAAPSDKIPSAFAEPVPGEVNGIPQDAADHLHEYGTFGQVHNLVRMDESGGATLIVMGHRRLKRTGVVSNGSDAAAAFPAPPKRVCAGNGRIPVARSSPLLPFVRFSISFVGDAFT